ncbi:hypothetical protein IW01_04615 [Pectobacterium brasiliense]|uniref:DUF3472 domain-containing protein n=1 Tax=Pectobacterium brasiliense TaxID=180957 RepID=UPI0004E684E5|nr:DUF3472 domain-containing protein [Pectobacterium brasiliense]KFF72186.1 hypothetical protein IW01_04615 [Pectobacterium brasiliense]GLY62337.1 hypothetical protein Pcaca05_31940 [Pectobacterium carotovorum subsp. carotovorum]
MSNIIDKKNYNENNHINSVPTSGPNITSYFEKNEAELLYVEQMVKSDGDKIDIYWSGCNFYFGERGGYAGIQHQNDNTIDGQIFTRNNICSIWDLADQDPSLPTEVTLTYGLPGLHSAHFGGEGTGLHTSHPMPWTQNQWYALVIRRWDNPAGSKTTGMAMFMYSYLHSKWTHYISADIPGEGIPLTGNTCKGFLERFSGDAYPYSGIYGQHFRMDKNGLWEKPTKYVASAGGANDLWNAELYGNENIILSVGLSDNSEDNITLKPNQSNKPKTLTPPIISLLQASFIKEKKLIDISWVLDDSTPPQLTFTVEIRNNDTYGNLLISYRETSPHKNNIQINIGDLQSGKYCATFEYYDIFNQKSNFGYTFFTV